MKKTVALIAAVMTVVTANAQSNLLSGVTSMSDGDHYAAVENGAIKLYDYASSSLQQVIFDAAEHKPEIKFDSYFFSDDESKIMFVTERKPIYRHSFTAQYWVYDRVDGSLRPLSENGPQQVATFSPDGTKAAFVRDNNLYWVNLAADDFEEYKITDDGRFNYILNGIPDWVYEEEYSFSRAYEWSPSSDKIAYMRTDEERVKEYDMNVFGDGLYPSVYTFKYPKAGEQNSVVTVNVFNLSSGETAVMETGDADDRYIPRIMWAGDKVAVATLNRKQNNFDLLLCDPTTGESRVIYHEEDDRYVDRVGDQTVTFFDDGDRFLVMNESSGYRHIYLYSITKGLLGAVTSGNYEVTDLMGVDQKKGVVYYISTETSPLKRDLYSVKLNGKGKKRLTGGNGTYSVVPSSGFNYYISYFSSAETPTVVELHKGDGKLIRELYRNRELEEKIANGEIATKKFFTFKNDNGDELYGYMLYPTDFDSTKNYPLFMTQYSGPGSQQVADRWGIGWESRLLEHGYIVACVDGRGTGFRGEKFRKCTYENLGGLEVEDQISAARYLGSLPYIDSTRIGIYGWSFGGFMALNCILKGNDVFKMAIAVAPVTNWRFYDTIYTELYNGLPQENPEGYDLNSPIHYADKLKGKLLLAHGTGDDNVHVQNSYRMIEAFAKAGKHFDLAIYPDRNHSMGADAKHLLDKCVDYVIANL